MRSGDDGDQFEDNDGHLPRRKKQKVQTSASTIWPHGRGAGCVREKTTRSGKRDIKSDRKKGIP